MRSSVTYSLPPPPSLPVYRLLPLDDVRGTLGSSVVRGGGGGGGGGGGCDVTPRGVSVKLVDSKIGCVAPSDSVSTVAGNPETAETKARPLNRSLIR